jgi:acetyl-CoA carboxylase/biotin carboxylase 1
VQDELRDMERCARALARSVGYVGAATVEYLYLIEEGKYCFLELNPRLQVGSQPNPLRDTCQELGLQLAAACTDHPCSMAPYLLSAAAERQQPARQQEYELTSRYWPVLMPPCRWSTL